MRSILMPLSLFLIFSVSCDQLGIDPNVNIDDCLTEKDRSNYKNLIANEKKVSGILALYDYDPEQVPESERQNVYDELTSLNALHDGYRSMFECQYWGEDNKVLTGITQESKDQVDPIFLNPTSYKGLFGITSKAVLTALSQEEWEGKNVYLFPGVSRIPWENASQANKERALERINDAYNEILIDLGESGDKVLFDPINDYIFPHCTYHQVFVSRFASAVISPNNLPAAELVENMAALQKSIVSKFINRAPDSIEL